MKLLRHLPSCDSFRGSTILLVALIAAPTGWAEYDDTLFLQNGDRLRGDVKELRRDMLRFKTDAMGTVEVKWSHVRSLESEKLLRIELGNGLQLVGSIAGSSAPNQLTVSSGSTEVSYAQSSFVAFVPLKLNAAWLQRVEGAVRFGLNGTKGSETIQWNVGANALYRGLNFDVSSRLDGIVAYRRDNTDSERISFLNSYRHFRPNYWYWNLLAGYDKNDELGVANRYSAGGGIGRFLIRSNTMEFIVNSGLLASREFAADETRNQIEGYLTGEFGIFHHSFPKTDLRASGTVFPSLTESGRWRTNLDVSLSQELIDDLALSLSVYYATDNQAPEESAEEDWGIVTALEYSF